MDRIAQRLQGLAAWRVTGVEFARPCFLAATPAEAQLQPCNQLIEDEGGRWAPFKRALAKEDQATLARLFGCAKKQVQAGVMVSRAWPFETIVMAVLLEQEKRIEESVRWLEGTTPGRASY
jgi:hypothetical protein